MARPREFKVEDAVGGAMDVFWEHGYEGASLPDLLAGMGLTRGSLYKAFTDKKSLYLVVLERYEQDYVIPAVGMLSGPEIEDGWDRVMALFGNVIADVKKGDRRGCLACSAAAGPASEDTEIADAVHRTLGKLQKGFEVALKASGTHAGLDSAARRQMADMLTTQYVGTRVMARSQAPVAMLKRSVASLRLLA
ncbi:MAG: TetR/AcrR family transcriptional regulator [Anderseniella sp.]